MCLIISLLAVLDNGAAADVSTSQRETDFFQPQINPHRPLSLLPDSLDLMHIQRAGIRFRRPIVAAPDLLSAKKAESVTSCVQKGRLLFVTGTLLSANYYAYHRFKDMWWNYPRTRLHLYRGWRQTEGWYDFGPHDSLWHHMDKLGHFYNTRLLSLLLSDTAAWIGFANSTSQWIGAVMSWLFYLQIEIYDGQFEQWGFSLGDLAANTAGAFMPLLQQHSRFLQKFTLKWSYFPSEIQQQKYVVEDYAGMTFWLTTNPQEFLPRFFDPFWPDFLNVALGYSVTKKTLGDIELFFGLDYDLTKIATHSLFWNRVLFYLNFLHLPAPAIRFRPTQQFFLLYY